MISIFKRKISQIEELIERLENDMDGENDDDIQEKIDELNENISEINDEITEIEDDPEGDFPEDLIEDTIQNRLSDVENNIESFMTEWGLNISDYINKDDFIYGVKAVFGWTWRNKMANVSFFSLFACEWIPELPLHFW